MMRCQTDERRLVPIPLACELPEIEFSRLVHLRCACIAEVGVVGPNDDLCPPAVLIEMSKERVECIGHTRRGKIAARGIAVSLAVLSETR
jgi:hypothetical protein